MRVRKYKERGDNLAVCAAVTATLRFDCLSLDGYLLPLAIRRPLFKPSMRWLLPQEN